MATELITRKICDECGAPAIVGSVEARDTTTVGAVSDGESVSGEIDLCVRHLDDMTLGRFLALVRDAGRPMKSAPAPDRRDKRAPSERAPGGATYHRTPPFYCLACWERCDSTDARDVHYRVAHDFGTAPREVEFMRENRCPLCPTAVKAMRGLVRHIGAAHKMNLSAALLTARDDGDPLGVVASLRTVDDLQAHPAGHYLRP